MNEFPLSLRRPPMIILAALLVILSGCLNFGGQSTSEPADPTSAPAIAGPTLTTTQPPAEVATVAPTTDLPIAPVVGALAPDFTLPNLNGDEVSLSDFRGKPVLINFWTTW